MLKGVFDEVWLATGDQNSSAYDQHRATAACLLSDTGADRRIRGGKLKVGFGASLRESRRSAKAVREGPSANLGRCGRA